METVEGNFVKTRAHKSPAADSPEWRRRLLPLMSRTLVGLAVFFFLATCLQLIFLNKSIIEAPRVDTHEALSLLVAKPDSTEQETLAAARLRALVVLEAASVDDQYHQAGVLLMSRIWTTYLGFLTGMILAVVGASFVLGRLQEESSELKAEVAKRLDISFKSASPGLVLALMGVILMITAILTHHTIDLTNRAIYLQDVQPTLQQDQAKPPTLVIPDVKNTH